MSASSKPTSAPALRSAAARLTATVDLPTPPFPDATAMVCLTPGRISEGFGRMNAGRTLAVIRTATSLTPGRSPTRSWAWVLKRSRTGHAGVVSSKVKLTLPCGRSEEHTSELQSRLHLVCRLLLEKKKKNEIYHYIEKKKKKQKKSE